jgi:hypothetical protein
MSKYKNKLHQLVVVSYQSGLSINELQNKYDMSESNIRHILSKNKIPLRSRLVEVNMLSETEKAYLAGLVDGEGWIGVELKMPEHTNGCRRASFMVTVRVVNTKRKCLDWIENKTGVGTVHPSRKKIKGQRLVYEYRACTLQAAAILKQIAPYLIIKQEQAKLVMTLAEIRFKQKKSGMNGITNEEWEKQYEIYKQVKMLNKRGDETKEFKIRTIQEIAA